MWFGGKTASFTKTYHRHLPLRQSPAQRLVGAVQPLHLCVMPSALLVNPARTHAHPLPPLGVNSRPLPPLGEVRTQPKSKPTPPLRKAVWPELCHLRGTMALMRGSCTQDATVVSSPAKAKASPPGGLRKEKGRCVSTEGDLPAELHGDLQVLLETFIAAQKRSGQPWRPVRQAQLAPVKIARQSLRELSSAGPEADEDFYSTMTRGVHLRSNCVPVSCAPSFEAVLRGFFRTVTPEELEAMLRHAEPLISWRKREFERRAWVYQANALGRTVTYAFARDDAFCYGVVCDGAKLLSVDLFAEAVALHRAGVNPDSLAVANLRNLSTMASVNRELVAADDACIARIVEAASDEGGMSLDDLITHVSYEPSLRSEFETIVKIGSVRRENMKNGFWKRPLTKPRRAGHVAGGAGAGNAAACGRRAER